MHHCGAPLHRGGSLATARHTSSPRTSSQLHPPRSGTLSALQPPATSFSSRAPLMILDQALSALHPARASKFTFLECAPAEPPFVSLIYMYQHAHPRPRAHTSPSPPRTLPKPPPELRRSARSPLRSQHHSPPHLLRPCRRPFPPARRRRSPPPCQQPPQPPRRRRCRRPCRPPSPPPRRRRCRRPRRRRSRRLAAPRPPLPQPCPQRCSRPFRATTASTTTRRPKPASRAASDGSAITRARGVGCPRETAARLALQAGTGRRLS